MDSEEYSVKLKTWNFVFLDSSSRFVPCKVLDGSVLDCVSDQKHETRFPHDINNAMGRLSTIL